MPTGIGDIGLATRLNFSPSAELLDTPKGTGDHVVFGPGTTINVDENVRNAEIRPWLHGLQLASAGVASAYTRDMQNSIDIRGEALYVALDPTGHGQSWQAERHW